MIGKLWTSLTVPRKSRSGARLRTKGFRNADDSYHASHFAFLARALQQSIKICVQIEREGFMCIQIMMPVGEGVDMGNHSGILEFKARYSGPNLIPKLTSQMNALEDDQIE